MANNLYMETKILNPNSSYLSFGNPKPDGSFNDHNMSDEDEPSFTEEGNGARGRKGNSQWQRMKWTDSRVRLLIQIVASVGDDDGVIDGGLNRKSAGCLQKKGKWKSVSKIMVTKGCQVSPQQCEDKFNDLNKRYKRLNDILGRGTSCRVVENPCLMDSIPRLSSKMKEDVKKILSSKHLFYPEMCAYHNGQKIPNCSELESSSTIVGQSSKDDDSDHDDDDESEDDDGSEDDGEREKGGGRGGGGDNNVFFDEMNEFFEDVNNSKVQKKEWAMKRMLVLLEQRIGIESEAFEMEKRRFKWERFCDRKDRELEVSRLENERLMLENERMALQLKRRDHVMDSE